jgi:DNA transposition AAA+ family ATPase
VVQEVKHFLEEYGKSQRWLADAIDVNPGQLSEYLRQKYAGDAQKIEDKLKSFIRNYIPTAVKNQDEAFYIETENTQFVHYIMRSAIKNVRLSAIFGHAGYGKTTAIRAFIRNHPEAIYIKINNLSTVKDFLQILCDRLNLGTTGRNMELFKAIVEALSGSGKFIVIDEAEWLKDKALDMVRNIWEESRVAVILSGTLNLERNLIGAHRELEYVNSRVHGRFKLRQLGDGELKRIAKAYGIEEIKLLKNFGKENFRTTMHLVEEAAAVAAMNGSDVITGDMLKEAYRMIG